MLKPRNFEKLFKMFSCISSPCLEISIGLLGYVRHFVSFRQDSASTRAQSKMLSTFPSASGQAVHSVHHKMRISESFLEGQKSILQCYSVVIESFQFL